MTRYFLAVGGGFVGVEVGDFGGVALGDDAAF
jgi:hypothetical protein